MEFKAAATPQGFNERYEANLSKARTYREAYELTEQEHIARFGNSKYSGYETFKTLRSRTLKVNKVYRNR